MTSDDRVELVRKVMADVPRLRFTDPFEVKPGVVFDLVPGRAGFWFFDSEVGLYPVVHPATMAVFAEMLDDEDFCLYVEAIAIWLQNAPAVLEHDKTAFGDQDAVGSTFDWLIHEHPQYEKVIETVIFRHVD